ncbi:MAG: hypothetical protein JNJ59_26545 [Deltaproteobacteria bacterium]|nr:hypothetical protein [Deltaproteobacteria bacterium]
MSALPPAALEFVAGPGTRDRAHALREVPVAELEQLLSHLVEQGALLHIDALAESDAAPKALRKSAKFALYQLRSRGVPVPVASRTVPLSEAPPVDLGEAAIVVLPGLYGRFWLFLGPLPGVAGIEVRGEAHGTLEKIEVLSGVAPGRMKKLLAKFSADEAGRKVQGHPFLASADLALRLLEHLEVLLRLPGHPDERGLPNTWPNVLLWREKALELGASPHRVDARAALGSPSADEARALAMDFDRALKVTASGIHVPPPWIVEAVLHDLVALAEKALAPEAHPGATETTPHALGVDFGIEVARAHCDAFLGHAQHAPRVASALEATADGLYALGLSDEARTFLALADVLRLRLAPPHEVPLFAFAFEQLADPDLLARARDATAR